jgi:hypothetical protein
MKMARVRGHRGMATQIIWDDVDTEPQPPEPKPELPREALLARHLEYVDINELIAELNRRGMVVTARTGVYMPATVSTSPYAQTTSVFDSVYTVPTTTSATTQLDFQHVTYGGLQQAALSGGIYQQSLGAVDAAKNKW